MAITDHWHHCFPVDTDVAQEVTRWLHGNLGTPARDRYDLNADWLWMFNSRPEGFADRYMVGIRDPSKAVLFKLTWG